MNSVTWEEQQVGERNQNKINLRSSPTFVTQNEDKALQKEKTKKEGMNIGVTGQIVTNNYLIDICKYICTGSSHMRVSRG